MGKNPAFQFYVYDWQTNRKLQRCSAKARGVWLELMCLMHDGEPYGHLTVEGDKLDMKEIATLTHLSLKSVRSGILELNKYNVPKYTSDDVMYSSRMVEDGRIRQARRDAGKLGGNPVLLNQKDKQGVKQDGKQKPTPSSSSSSSSSKDLKRRKEKPVSDKPKKVKPGTIFGKKMVLQKRLARNGYWNETRECENRLDKHLAQIEKEANTKDDPDSYFVSVAEKRMIENFEVFKPSRGELDNLDSRMLE